MSETIYDSAPQPDPTDPEIFQHGVAVFMVASPRSMTIEKWGDSAKLIYHIKDPPIVLTIASALDGSESPVLMNGKPSGETMAIKIVDKLHSVTIVKMDGKAFGTSKGTFSSDFNTLTVENDFTGPAAGGAAGKTTEHWVRK